MQTHLQWTALSDQGQRRQNNEDAWNAMSLGELLARMPADARIWPAHGFLLMVSDGMGGAKAGEEASRLCIQRLPAELYARRKQPDMLVAMREALVATHAALVEAATEDSAKDGMGATLSALWLKPDGQRMIGHVGDSRIYCRHGDGWVQLTEDQSVGAGMVRRGELSAEDVNRLRYRSMLEQVMGGDGTPIEPQLTAGTWAPGDEYLLCSDGLYGPLGEDFEQVVNGAFREPSLGRAAQVLVDRANAAGGPDNITVVVAQLLPISPA
jgi:PPM family protein phosphatase